MMKGNNTRLCIKRIVSVMLIAGGIMLMLYPLYTLIYAQIYQKYEMRMLQNPAMETSVARTVSGDTVEAKKQVPTSTKSTKDISPEFEGAILEIPTIQLSAAVLKGTSQEVLAKGPGWYEESALPGQGNTGIAGHLNTYGCWFRNIGTLHAGDDIYLIYEGQTFRYQVERVYSVKSTDWSIVEPCGYKALTLSTCIAGDPSHRLVVRARQIGS